MRAIEREDAAAPRFARVHDERSPLGRRPLENPGWIRPGHVRPFRDRKGRDPEPRLKTRRVNPIGEPAVAVRELGVHVPIAGGALIAVVELDVAEEAAVEVCGAEVDVGQHVAFRDRRAELVPGAPTRRDCKRGDTFAVHR